MKQRKKKDAAGPQSKSQSPPEDDGRLADAAIATFFGRRVSIGTLVVVFIFLLTVPYKVVDVFLVDRVERDLDVAKSKKQALENELTSCRESLTASRALFAGLREGLGRAVLISPTNNRTVICPDDGIVRFNWCYPGTVEHEEFVLEVRDLSTPVDAPKRFNVLKNLGQVMNIPLSRFGKADKQREYLWRICRGRIVKEKLVSTEPWSPYESFVVYPSVTDRIRQTGKLRIGFNATFIGHFNLIDGQGGYEGVDQEFMEWLCEELRQTDGLSNVEPDRVELPWLELLPALRDHRVDIVISSMTNTKRRERDYPGLRFSHTYLDVDQIFIGRDKLQVGFPAALKGKRVAAQVGSVNHLATKLLADDYGYTGIAMETYVDMLREIEAGTVDFAIVDKVLVRPYLGHSVYQYGPPINEELQARHPDQEDRFGDGYAIAVRDQGLLERINKILDGSAAREFVEEQLSKVQGK